MASFESVRTDTGAARCLECGKCSTLCPLAPFGGFSAARMVALRDASSSAASQSAAIDRCLTCGACETRCPQGVQFSSFVLGVRSLAPPEWRSPCPHGEVLQEAARWSTDLKTPARDLSWVGDGLKVASEGDTALFVGCLPLFDTLFGEDFEVPAYIHDAQQAALVHPWYDTAMQVVVNDFYAFDENMTIDLATFEPLISKHFFQPERGLGFDDSPAAHMWRTMIWPNNFL